MPAEKSEHPTFKLFELLDYLIYFGNLKRRVNLYSLSTSLSHSKLAAVKTVRQVVLGTLSLFSK